MFQFVEVLLPSPASFSIEVELVVGQDLNFLPNFVLLIWEINFGMLFPKK